MNNPGFADSPDNAQQKRRAIGICGSLASLAAQRLLAHIGRAPPHAQRA